MTMTILDLPRVLLEEIFSKLPLMSMRSLRLTCKTFYSLTKSPSFAKLHIGKEEEATREGESRMIVLMDYNLYWISVVVNGDSFVESKGKLAFLNDSDQVKIYRVFHCDGLVLCMLEDDTRFVVWNPYWGQTRWIKPRYSRLRNKQNMSVNYVSVNYALGYVDNKSCRCYKLLRFIDFYFGGTGQIDIYDLESGLWTTTPDVTHSWRIESNGVSIKGNTYWHVTLRSRRSNSFNNNHQYITCFDFTKERFGPLIRLPFTADYVTLSCVREEKLSVLLVDYEANQYKFEIWITSKIEAEKLSWSKFLKIDMGHKIPSMRGSFFIDEEKKVVMVFDKTLNPARIYIIGEDGYFRQVSLGEIDDMMCMPHVFTYVPSLVQIKQPPQGPKRRRKA